jgi:hydrogenase maturation factor
VPRWFLATVLLPERGATAALAEAIFAQIADACASLDVSLCGGHTEITYGLDRPIVVGQMLGEVAHDRYLTSSGARPGDALILTKGYAVEGTALCAREKRAELAEIMSEEEIARCAGFLRDPGLSVVRDARLAIEAGGVHALHDPTEGGVATGLWELAEAAGAGLVVDEARLPLLPECAALCRHLGLDPLGMIGSGALLIAADPERASAITARLEAAGIRAERIGEMTGPGEECRLRRPDGGLAPLPRFARDEVARLFD